VKVAWGANPVQHPRLSIPLLIWLLIQWLALALGAAGVLWSANYPVPGDLQSLRVLLVVQLVAATLLQRWLLRSAVQTMVCALCTIPFTIAGGYLSGHPFVSVMGASIYVAICILIVGIGQWYKWYPLLPYFVALSTLLVVGGPAFDYLIREFGNGKIVKFGPIFDVFQVLAGDVSMTCLIAPAGSLLAAFLTRRMRFR
jgi:hypothetical protein